MLMTNALRKFARFAMGYSWKKLLRFKPPGNGTSCLLQLICAVQFCREFPCQLACQNRINCKKYVKII